MVSTLLKIFSGPISNSSLFITLPSTVITVLKNNFLALAISGVARNGNTWGGVSLCHPS